MSSSIIDWLKVKSCDGMRMGGCYAMYQYRTMTSIWMEKQGWLSSFLSVQVDIFSEEVTLVKTKQKQIISDNILCLK